MKLYIHDKGQTSGPFDESEIKEALFSKKITPTALACLVGETQWRPLNQILDVSAEFPPPPPPPPLTPLLTLWNPLAAAAWSIILTPAFGAFLHAKNWQALGRPVQAERSEQWAWGFTIIFGIICYRASKSSVELVLMVWLLGLFGWYFMAAQEQIALVNRSFGESYHRSKWSVPLVIGFSAAFVYNALFSYLLTQRPTH